MTQVIETDEEGRLVLSPELLREMFGEGHPHALYVVEVHEGKIHISPEQTAPEFAAAQSKPSVEQWERQWGAVQEKVSASWPVGVSAADVIAEMRR